MTMGTRFSLWSMKKKIVALMFCFMLPIASWCIHAWAQAVPDCPVALTDHPVNGKTCPVVGHMGNVKLAIPEHYILGPVAYKGVDIWNAESYKNRPKHPTLDTEIDNFAIKIRLNNFKPVETRKDWADYDKLGGIRGWAQPLENRWIYVGFETAVIRPTSNTMKQQLNNWLKDDAHWGPFVQSDSVWGLQHYVSVQQPSTSNDQREIFYDPETEDTFISCENRLIAVPPYEPISFCEIDFLVREMNLSVHVSNINFKQDLSRWKNIEQGIRRVVQSFVVP